MLDKYVAPYLISTPGRIIALLCFGALTAFTVNGCMSIRLYWGDDLYHDESVPTHGYYKAINNLFQMGKKPYTYVWLDDNLDFSDEKA